MENPLSGMELFVGGIFGLVGFGVGDLTDRLIATHAITLKSAATSTTPALYADTPPTSGDYQGLFNPTAITAPMNILRWVNAIGGPAVLFTIARFIPNVNVRAAFQFGAFGYGVRTVGKGLIDLVAKLSGSMQIGQQLYDGELRAQVLQANQGNNQAPALGNLPAAGLGRVPCGKCNGKPGCADCARKGLGWPSMPRELPAATSTTAPTAPPAAPPAVIPPPASVMTAATPARPATPATPPGASTSGLTGAPKSKWSYGNYDH